MIYFISDLHGNKDFKGLQDYLSIATDEDLLIILGDLCLNFEPTEENRIFTEYFLSLEKPIAFLDGNHENFSYVNAFPEETWNGGKVHRLSKYLVHMKRGEIYTLEGKTFFTFGGCKSSAKWAQMGLWYPGEQGTKEEFQYACNNLRKHENSVDYILTHKYENNPAAINICVEPINLTEYLENHITYRKWYFGHAHRMHALDENHFCIYTELTQLI